ncbi:MAG TPA: dTDP-4-dehydrorhamnose reductase, partial [Deltaproteobacteria bacterium]|nr:dTDP-4-dehydrorhamnose reductase [Deltaproteobacteria bacterium]
MKVLVFGNTGMLGKDLISTLDTKSYDVVGIDRKTLDFRDLYRIPVVLRDISPDVVINSAAYTNVDLAEKEKEIATKINRDAPGEIAKVCGEMKIPLLHISTDYVFSGNTNRPYVETDETSPVNFYGWTKLEGELAIKSVLQEHLIIRTSWLYGKHGKNFVKTILKLAREKEELKVVSDQFGNPTWTRDLSEAIAKIVDMIVNKRRKIIWGVYHFSGLEEVSWYQFARKIVEYGKKYDAFRVKNILPISSS